MKKSNLFSGPVSISWEEGASLPVLRQNHTAVLCDGVIYVGTGSTRYDIDKENHVQISTRHVSPNMWDTIDTPHHAFGF